MIHTMTTSTSTTTTAAPTSPVFQRDDLDLLPLFNSYLSLVSKASAIPPETTDIDNNHDNNKNNDNNTDIQEGTTSSRQAYLAEASRVMARINERLERAKESIAQLPGTNLSRHDQEIMLKQLQSVLESKKAQLQRYANLDIDRMEE